MRLQTVVVPRVWASRLAVVVIVVLAPIVTATLAFAADGAGVPAPPTLASRTFRAEDGLPSNVVAALAQDRDGYLWVGSADGLVRFDGLQFVAWGARGESPLPYAEVNGILADRDGSIWVSFRGGNAIARLSGSRITTYTTQDGLPERFVRPRAQDRDGTVWAVGFGGIAVFRANAWEQLRGTHGLPEGPAYDVYEDKSGALWLSTASGIFRRSPGQDDFALVDRRVATELTGDLQGRLWLGHPSQGVHALTSAGEPALDLGEHASVMGLSSMVSDRRGDLWLGSNSAAGLLRVSIDPRTSQVTALPVLRERALLNTNVLALFEDSDGNVWAGTSGGLLLFRTTQVQTYTRANGLPDDHVRVIHPTANGEVWLGTGSGLATVTAQGLAVPPHVPGVERRAITSLHADRSGKVWIGFADSGMGVLADGHFSALQTPGTARSGNIITVRPDQQGGLWVCNQTGGGLFYRRSDAAFAKVPGAPETCSATLLDRRGRVWVGFEDGSLMVREPDSEPRFLRGAGTPDARVCALYEDQNESIWMASQAGLTRYRNGAFSTITARNGLPGNYVSAVIEDQDGHLWVSSNSGVFRLTKEEFDRAAGDPTHRVLYTPYDSFDGVMDTPVCYGEPHAARDRAGRLWFASLSGAIAIDPRRLRQPAPVSAHLEQIVGDGVVFAGDSFSLPPRTAKIELQYNAVSLTAARRIRFQHRLVGFDQAWVNAGARRQAFYANLKPGHYRFEVRASIDDVMGPTTASEFDLLPAFYQTSAFYGGTVVAAAGLLWGAWRLRVRRLHARYTAIMDERSRIGREIHDTVLQNMTGAALAIDAVALSTPRSDVRGTLASISNDLKDHIAEVRHTIWELRTPEENVSSLENALRDAGEQILDETHCRFELTVVGTPRDCGRTVERELIRIAREALRNTVRHADATRVRAELRYGDDELSLSITDDGSGFDVDERLSTGGYHWGLVGMKERAGRIGARFNIRSQPGTGTAIELVAKYAHD